MTRPKPSYSTNNLRTPICTQQVACDGINLVGNARERGYCTKCAEAMAKRGKKEAPTLRGENSALQGKLKKLLPDNWNRHGEDD
jgi:hypothetical protein